MMLNNGDVPNDPSGAACVTLNLCPEGGTMDEAQMKLEYGNGEYWGLQGTLLSPDGDKRKGAPGRT